jgi:hypothetical protein
MSVLGQRWPHAHAEGWNAMDMPGLFVMAVLALVVWLAVNVLQAPVLFPPATYSGQQIEQRVSSPACAEAARLRAHGATASPAYARVRVACTRAAGRP